MVNRKAMILTIVFFLIFHVGCQPTKTPEVSESKFSLIGSWVVQEAIGTVNKKYDFKSNSEFNITYYSNDTSFYDGRYWVVDSMVHMVLNKNGSPIEEIWLRMKYLEDSIYLFKGILLKGESERLIGIWKCESYFKDSLGFNKEYTYTFSNEGRLIISGTGLGADTSGFTYDPNLISTTDHRTGKSELSLGYSLYENKLALYNLDAKEILHRKK